MSKLTLHISEIRDIRKSLITVIVYIKLLLNYGYPIEGSAREQNSIRQYFR
jgi:hypothetical protein